MKYRNDRYGNPISVLGYGCLRLTRKDGKVDMEKAVSEVRTAYEAGINYFDTAWAYGDNEAVMGEIFERLGIRDKVKIATKLPHYYVKKKEDFERYFSEELARLRTDHVDYYLMHMLNDAESFRRLKDLGLEEWLEEKKKKGQIRQVGFSYHGNSDAFGELLAARDWDFCQIQYNYMDEHTQAGRAGLEAAYAKGIPVVIMEPLRGGKLAKLPREAQNILNRYPLKRSPAAWSFLWLWDQPGVTCVLSGMNSLEMIRENLRTADEAEAGSFGEEERKLIADVLAEVRKSTRIGCTGCGYCQPCPKNVDIPGAFNAYNDFFTAGPYSSVKEYLMCTRLRKEQTGIGNCIGCGACEKKCPQGIAIRQELKRAGRLLENPLFKGIYAVTRKILRY